MRHRMQTISGGSVTLWINLVLIGASLLLVFYYVALSNIIAEKSYGAQILYDKVESLAEKNILLTAQKLPFENPVILADLAESMNLVVADDALHIFENRNVARK